MNEEYVKKLSELKRRERELELEYINKKIELYGEIIDLCEEELFKEYVEIESDEEQNILEDDNKYYDLLNNLYESKKLVEKVLEEF